MINSEFSKRGPEPGVCKLRDQSKKWKTEIIDL